MAGLVSELYQPSTRFQCRVYQQILYTQFLQSLQLLHLFGNSRLDSVGTEFFQNHISYCDGSELHFDRCVAQLGSIMLAKVRHSYRVQPLMNFAAGAPR